MGHHGLAWLPAPRRHCGTCFVRQPDPVACIQVMQLQMVALNTSVTFNGVLRVLMPSANRRTALGDLRSCK
jgi:hypothetical protein